MPRLKELLLRAPVRRALLVIFLALFLVGATDVLARPITYPGGTTLMIDYDAGSDMVESQVFFTGARQWSVGPGYLTSDRSDSEDTQFLYLQGSWLLKRWNMPAAQANVFVWGGPGLLKSAGEASEGWHAGGQADYETRRVYFSVNTHHYEGGNFELRRDTWSAGFAPYLHDYDRMASWLLVRGIHETGSSGSETRYGLLARFFKGPWFVEIGVDEHGKALGYLMYAF
jgi:hypothetical protein